MNEVIIILERFKFAGTRDGERDWSSEILGMLSVAEHWTEGGIP